MKKRGLLIFLSLLIVKMNAYELTDAQIELFKTMAQKHIEQFRSKCNGNLPMHKEFIAQYPTGTGKGRVQIEIERGPDYRYNVAPQARYYVSVIDLDSPLRSNGYYPIAEIMIPIYK